MRQAAPVSPGGLAPIVVVLALAGACGLAWSLGVFGAAADAPVAARVDGQSEVPPAQPPAVAAAATPAQPEVTPPAAVPAQMQFPDGSSAPALNGVTESVKLVWNDRPFAKVKEKIVDRGWEWYVHEDGSHSTVKMVDLNGVPAPIGIVASPTEALPTTVEIEQRVQQQLGGQQGARE